MRRVVRKVRSTEEVTVEVEDGECPACAAIREGGCDSGVIFLECDGVVYRCEVMSLPGFRVTTVLCEVSTYEAAMSVTG
jgi:hypothetical protein